MDALSAEVDRKMDALSAEMDALFAEVGRAEAQWYSNTPEQAIPSASPPPVIAPSPVAPLASSPAPPPATSPVLPPASEAAADADRRIAAVERERDAATAEVDRLQSHRDSTSPEQATPASPPPVIAPSPVAPLASSPAPPPATSPVLPPASEAAADADRPVAAVERESDAMAAEVARLQGHQDSTSPEQNKPPASPPPAVAVSPAPPPATSPVLPPASEAAADADRPVAAVERESDAMAAEVARLQSHQDSTSPEQNKPPASPPPVIAPSPVAPLASEAAADADRPVAAVERESDAMAAEVGRLQGHQDSTSPEQNKPPASPPPVIAPSPVAPLASEAAADADRRIAAVERESDAMAAEVARLQGHQDSTSPEQNKPPASPPPVIAPSPVAPLASSPAPPLASSPVLPPASEAAADADRPVAAVERESDAMAAEVARLQSHQDSTSPEQNKPPASPPPVIAPSPAPPPATSPVLPPASEATADADRLVAPLASSLLAPPTTSPVAPPASEAAADADRRIAALERERDALAAEVGRLERHRDSTSPGQAISPASPPPAIPAERSDLEPSPASASLPDGMAARVLIRYPRNDADAQRHAESLANALTRQGVEVAALRESAGAIRTELSSSYAPDEAIALRVGGLAGIVPVRRTQPKDGFMARPGTVELSLSGDNHLAVITTSTKESNAAREDPRPAPPVVHAGVADLAEACRRDGDRLARLRASPSGEEAQRFASELGCEALRLQLQRLMESLGLVAPAPPSAANSTASSDSVLAQVCASERAALDRLRKEPSAEAARLFWRDLKCARLLPQVHLLVDSLNATPRPLGSAAEPGDADSRVTIDLPTANGTDTVACRRETAELDRIRAKLDLGDAKRFASAVTCDALRRQAARLLDSLKE